MPTSYVIPPFSVALLNAGQIYPNYYFSTSVPGVQRYKGIGVAGTGTINATGEFVFQIPQGLPSGTPTLNGYAITNGTGVASYSISWGSFTSGQNPMLQNLSNEGTGTIVWSAGQSGVLKGISVPLDAYASGITPGSIVTMDIKFVAPCTLTFASTWRFWMEYK